MTEFLKVVCFWLFIMVFIGIALWLVPKISAHIEKNQKKEDKETIQDVADE